MSTTCAFTKTYSAVGGAGSQLRTRLRRDSRFYCEFTANSAEKSFREAALIKPKKGLSGSIVPLILAGSGAEEAGPGTSAAPASAASYTQGFRTLSPVISDDYQVCNVRNDLVPKVIPDNILSNPFAPALFL